MNIELFGLSGVKIQTGEITILLSPPNQTSELKNSRMKGDVVVLGKPGDKTNITPAAEKLFVIKGPGEYESSGVFFYCLPNPPEGKVASLLTSLVVEGITITHLGGLNRELVNRELELFEGTDVLLIPTGGNDVLDAKKANEIVGTLEPRVVIPMHFARTGLTTKYDDATAFLKETGVKTEQQDRVKIIKKDLPQDTMDVIYLTP